MNAEQLPTGENEDEDEPPLEVLTDEEHWDAELKALVAIVETFGELDAAAVLRVMRYARERYLPKHRLVELDEALAELVRCSECDPSFGCFNGSAPCCKVPP